jgi:PST family polysaccharide transporter/antigen flippase
MSRLLTIPVRRLTGRVPFDVVAAAIAHGLRMVVNLAVIKMIAVSLGPVGLGAIGNLISVLSVVMVFAGGGIANGIAKFAAQYRGQPRLAIRLIETASAFGLLVSGLVLIITVLAARPIAEALFARQDLWWLGPVLGASHLACFVGTATIAWVNGYHRSDIFAGISIVGYLGCLPVAVLLIHFFGFAGAALALMAMAGCTALPALWVLLRAPIMRVIKVRLHKQEVLNLLRFSGMTLVSALAFPATEIAIRTTIIDNLGVNQAGLWQALIRLSGAILGFYTVYLATSYMPRLSAMHEPTVITRFVSKSLMQIGGAFALIAFVIYVARSAVIPLLYSHSFDDLTPLLGWQLAGDFFRVCAYVIGFVIIARARLALHIGAELVQYLIYGSISLAILRFGGDLAMVVRGYAVSYAIYCTIGLGWFFVWGRRLQ